MSLAFFSLGPREQNFHFSDREEEEEEEYKEEEGGRRSQTGSHPERQRLMEIDEDEGCCCCVVAGTETGLRSVYSHCFQSAEWSSPDLCAMI